MTWRKTATYWVFFVLLAGYFYLFERQPSVAPEPEFTRERILPGFDDPVTGFALRRDGAAVELERVDKRWKAVSPAGAEVPHDLVQALVETFTKEQEAEVIEAEPNEERLAAFGLNRPGSVFELTAAGGRKVTIAVGHRNPPRTAIYARTSLSPRVLLVGLNVEYYGDLMYQAAFAANAGKKGARLLYRAGDVPAILFTAASHDSRASHDS